MTEQPWGVRTRAHGLMGGLLLWATRVAAAGFILFLLDGHLHLPGVIGVLALLAAPLVAMVVASIQYAREKDWSEAALALLLLVMLIVGALLGRA